MGREKPRRGGEYHSKKKAEKTERERGVERDDERRQWKRFFFSLSLSLSLSHTLFFPYSREPVPDLAPDKALDDGHAAPSAERSAELVVGLVAASAVCSASAFPVLRSSSSSSPPSSSALRRRSGSGDGVEASVGHRRRRRQPQQPLRGLPPRRRSRPLGLEPPLLDRQLDERVPDPREAQHDHGQVGGDGGLADQQQLERQGRRDEPGVDPVGELAEEAQRPDQERPQGPVGVEHGEQRQGQDVQGLGGPHRGVGGVDASPGQLGVDGGEGDLAEDDDEVEDDEKGLKFFFFGWGGGGGERERERERG